MDAAQKEILEQLRELNRSMGRQEAKTEALEAGLAALRDEVRAARVESSERLTAAVDVLNEELVGLSEQSDRRHGKLDTKISDLRAIVRQCPQHSDVVPPPTRRKLRSARRSITQSIAVLLGIAAAAASGWWATLRGTKADRPQSQSPHP